LTEAGTTRAQIDKARTELVPRKKFAFRKGKNRGGKPTGSDAEGATQSHLDGGLRASISDGSAATASSGSVAPGGPGSDDASRNKNSAVAEATHCWAGKVGILPTFRVIEDFLGLFSSKQRETRENRRHRCERETIELFFDL